mgnify:CR=1 FL=1
MRTYEALYIVNPELGDDDIQTVATQVETLVTSNGGTIVRSEIWGKRKLAYPVEKHTEGVYVLLRFEAEPSFAARLENHVKLAEPIIRYLLVHFDEHTLRLETEQERRREEDLRNSTSSRGGRRDEDNEEEPARAGARRRRRDDEEEEE